MAFGPSGIFFLVEIDVGLWEGEFGSSVLGDACLLGNETFVCLCTFSVTVKHALSYISVNVHDQ